MQKGKWKEKSLKEQREEEKKETAKQSSFFGSLIHEFLIAPSIWVALGNICLFILYIVVILLLTDHQINLWYGLLLIPILFLLNVIRRTYQEKERLEILHTIPFFADSMANTLSVGETLEQAFIQSAHYLKGKIKFEFDEIILKNALGKNLDVLLKGLDEKFPNTGLIYLISLLNSYNELGVGISPLLKKISGILKLREKAEEKIRTILAAGVSYAWLTIGVFGVIFLILGFILKDQFSLLVSPQLKPFFTIIVTWSFVGILIVTRITSLEYTRTTSFKPYIEQFFNSRKLTNDEIFKYCGIKWTSWMMRLYSIGPLIAGVIFAYLISGFYDDIVHILIGFVAGYFIAKGVAYFILNGLVVDQLIRTIEVFPELLQIFIIGLNSGLNNYLSFEFALNAVKCNLPKILEEELYRTKFAMECGEELERTWRHLAARLPFESVVDFADIMIIAPIHGESIVDSIVEMANSYQEKKLLLIEKKATRTSQFVVPLIVVAFFPLFIFFVFAPMITKIINFLNS